MRHTLSRRASLALSVALISSGALAQSNDERLDALESRVDSLQQDLRAAGEQRVTFNGFLSTGYARASNDAGFDGVTEESEAQSLTLFGLQGRFDISDSTNATVQLLSFGEDSGRSDFATQLEWGYISHELQNGLRVRAGQMRIPLFMYSDSLDLGYAQPWARSPGVVYNQVTLSNYTGVDAAKRFSLGGGSVRAQAFGGHSSEEQTVAGQPGDIELRNLVGGVLSWSDYTWTLRGVAARADTSFEFLGNDEVDGEFYGFGVEYDDGSLMAISEVTRREVGGIFADTDSAYATVGYRIDGVMPYATVGWLESQDDNLRSGQAFSVQPSPGVTASIPAAVLNEQRTVYSLGARYDVMPGVALKADWTHARNFGDTNGGLSGNGALTPTFEHTNVYTVKIDAAF
ncbi:hypothetical protein CF392_02280 [Tamilnaduibacter salinus]|uniref:Porin n=1 Tax=Tamilnaduibacter salinus TaxID=1484056 RepID=A0A2A2I730_9GAMM|nr:hypothetical protein [Tamilnaduibacter salinus]PAV27116.1 hypothetical protein CF392_02280 [Tamilnaduibacter salinus]